MHLRLREEILCGNYGFGVKFIYEYDKELMKLDGSIRNGYNEIFDKFKVLVNNELTKSNKTNKNINHIFDEIESSNNNLQTNLLLSHQNIGENEKKYIKKKPTIKRKKKHDVSTTSQEPDMIDKELKNLVQNASDLLGNNVTKLSIKKEKVSSSFVKKKPSLKNKKTNNFQTDNDTNESTCNENGENTSNLTKTIVKTEITLERNDLSSASIELKAIESSSTKIKKQPSKKMRLAHKEELANIDEEENTTSNLNQVDQIELKQNKKKSSTRLKKARKSSTKTKSNQLILFRMPEPLATSSLSTTLINNIKEINVIANTPNTKLNKEIAESNSKTIKANQDEHHIKPMTRRAAAAAAAIAAENNVKNINNNQPKTKVIDEITKSIHQSGKVKQMVELHEARMNKPAIVPSTPSTSAVKSNAIRQLQYSTSKFKSTVQTTSSSQANIANNNNNNNNSNKIRSSIDSRKMRISNQKAKCDNKRQSVKKVNAFIKDLSETQSSGISIKSEKLSFSNNENENDNDDLEIQSIKNEPISNHTSQPIIPSTVKKLLATSSNIQQQYKLINTPGFTKFLERNTPSKMSKTQLEEKRKAELVTKEKKDQERLHEREKQQQEKIEIAKKKREERMKKIAELKAQKEQDDLKKKEELEAKLREVEENKKRILEEKKREEYEKQKARELRLQQQQTNSTTNSNTSDNVNVKPNILATPQHVKPQFAPTSSTHTSNAYSKTNQIKPNHQQHLANSSHTTTHKNVYENLSTFKSAQQFQQTNKQLNPLQSSNVINQHGQHQSELETTYSKPSNHPINNTFSKEQNHKPTTPYKENSSQVNRPVIKIKYENYDLSDLRSDDETDDDEEPSKPIPQWAKEILPRARQQAMNKINFTQLFKSTSQNEIILDNIFRVKRKKFYERSSSANWDTPPIWKTGINGNESFRQLHY